MPLFEYKGINSSGKNIKGSIDADNSKVARSKLKSTGILVTDISEGKFSQVSIINKDIKKLFSSEKTSLKTLANTTRQLATLLNSGITLVDSLQALGDQTENALMQKSLIRIRESVEEGNSFAKSLKAFPKSFPNLYVSMVASGEASGTLDTVLTNLANYLDSQIELRRKVMSALLYPILMLAFSSLVVAGLLAFVVPKIVEIFTKQGATLPIPTRIMILISYIIVNFWYLIILFIISFVVGIKWYHRKPTGKSKIDSILLKLPIFSSIYQKVFTARVSQTLGTLLSSGVGLLVALDIVKNIVANTHVRKALEDARDGVREGKSLAKELSKSGLFPKLLSHMVAIGEKSGKLDDMLSKAGDAYDKEVKSTLNNFSSILEPLMIITVGCIVFVIVISVLMPMVGLMDVIQM